MDQQQIIIDSFKTQWGFGSYATKEDRIIKILFMYPSKEEALDAMKTNYGKNKYRIQLQKIYQEFFQQFFANPSIAIPFELDFEDLSDFQKKVYTCIQNIPPGKCMTYGEVAQKLHMPKSARAIGMAMKANPFPGIIPCHRVIAANKKLHGFSAHGGPKLKQQLLEYEKTQ